MTLGVLLTMVTIGLVPRWVDAWGWPRAYMPLAIGPVVGSWCMMRLRRYEVRRAGIGRRG